MPKNDITCSKGIQFLVFNINNIQPKIELRYIARSSNDVIIGISETKLDHTI